MAPEAGVEVEIASASAPALVQDAGRPGRMHQGLPRGGAMVPELLRAANVSLGNAPGAAALEAYGELRLTVRGGPLWISVDGVPRLAADGETALVERPSSAVARYVAFQGGLDVPEQLGGRGTLPVAGIGRALRKGDRVRVAAALAPATTVAVTAASPTAGAATSAAAVVPSPVILDWSSPVRILRGPDLDRFASPEQALEALTSTELTVSPASDRTGTRLTGVALPRTGDDRPGPAPMVRGAIQVPSSGEPIVLGPDHPVTGGYPVVAVVISADWGRISGRRPGTRVRFRLVEPGDALAATAVEQEVGWE